MTIISYPNGKHRAVVRLKGKSFAETFETLLEAQNFEQRKTAEILALSSKAVFDKVPDLTFEQALKKYFASSNFKLKAVATQKTEQVKAKSLLKHFADFPVSQITSADVQNYFDDRSKQSTFFNDKKTVRNQAVRPDTLRLEKVVLSNLYKYLNKHQISIHNPIKNFEFDLQQPTEDFTVIAVDDLVSILQARPEYESQEAEDTFNVWFNITLNTAMRPGEASALLVEYFDKQGKGFLIPSKSQKNRRPHFINLHDELILMLEKQIERARKNNSPYIFYSIDKKGNVIPFNYSYYWKRVKAEAGITKPLKPHQLRHTAITYLAKHSGLSLHELMIVTGHTSVASLKRYLHLFAGDYRINVEKVSDVVEKLIVEHFFAKTMS